MGLVAQSAVCVTKVVASALRCPHVICSAALHSQAMLKQTTRLITHVECIVLATKLVYLCVVCRKSCRQ